MKGTRTTKNRVIRRPITTTTTIIIHPIIIMHLSPSRHGRSSAGFVMPSGYSRGHRQMCLAARGPSSLRFLSLRFGALPGPIFGFSDTWQLVINTGTTIVTFLMVFLIQNTQNRDCAAVHLKLDELIRALKGARNRLVDLEKLSDDELKKLEGEFERIQKRARHTTEAVEKVAAETSD